MSGFDVNDDGWLPGRGNYGQHYASDLVELVEARNCVRGCAHSGSERDRQNIGPSGICEITALMLIPERVKGLVHDGGCEPGGHPAPLCTVRQDPATANTDPLFEVSP